MNPLRRRDCVLHRGSSHGWIRTNDATGNNRLPYHLATREWSAPKGAQSLMSESNRRSPVY
jgi:hypothetical protein